MMLIALFFVALLANTLSAMAGGGAGLIQFPVLLWLGLPFATALGTHKIASVALGIGATVRHLRGGSLNKRVVSALIIGGSPGVVIGALLIIEVPEYWATLALGLLIVGLGIYSGRRKDLGISSGAATLSIRRLVWGSAGLCLLGILNGSLTSGTGLFVTLWLVRVFRLDYKTAVAHTLVLVGLLWNGLGAATVATQTAPAWDWLVPLLAGSLIGGYLGAVLSQKGKNQHTKRLYEALTFVVGISMIVKALTML